ncbi:interferon-activable protein 203 isoform X1 [Cricetulus griseus]|uniref:interferon-activable protein 203 isoform X1 n=1 Tax=Cricetulus griseus TaxID=10029 RepID=UPI00022F43A9|nr:interferon-activable protein 203 isoform X1 [Cricetulus griseus]XP_027290933.1 interferon-activable protein 203 isoform X1 [Cricetulus griseus]
MSEYKTIVLLKGMKFIDDNHFRTIKSLLRKKLNLTKEMQEDYDRFQIADLMEDKFPNDAGLDTLIEVCQSIEELKGLAKNLKTEKAKVKSQKKEKNKTAGKQDEPSSSKSLPTGVESNKNKASSKKKRKTPTKTEGGNKKKLTQETTQLPEPSQGSTQTDQGCLQTPQKPPPTPSSSSTNKRKQKTPIKTEGGKKRKLTQEPTQPLAPSGSNTQKDDRCLQTPLKPPPTPSIHSSNKKLGRRNIPKEPSKEQGHQHGPKEVMVLKVTEPFTYDLIDNKMMFHATVATETEFFRVKVFNTALKDKFFPKNIIAISDYFGTNGFLEIHSTTSVSDVNVNQMMVISNALKQRASATPKIKDLFSLPKGTYMNGEFVVIKKTERNNFIYYGIEDDTGKMEVVVYGRLTSIKCEPGNKLRLVCFELSSSEDTWQLKSVRHSYMQVINVRRKVCQH